MLSSRHLHSIRMSDRTQPNVQPLLLVSVDRRSRCVADVTKVIIPFQNAYGENAEHADRESDRCPAMQRTEGSLHVEYSVDEPQRCQLENERHAQTDDVQRERAALVADQ